MEVIEVEVTLVDLLFFLIKKTLHYLLYATCVKIKDAHIVAYPITCQYFNCAQIFQALVEYHIVKNTSRLLIYI